MGVDKSSNDFEEKRTNLGKKIFLSIIAILLVLGVCIFIFGHQYLKESLKPLNPNNKSVIQVKIPMGASDKKIGSILQDKKIVKSGMVFNYYVNSNHYSDLKAGYYELSPSMSLKAIANKLRSGGSDQPLQGVYGRLLVREGDNINDIANTVEKRSRYSSDDFKKLMVNKDFLNSLKKKYPKLLASAFKSKKNKYVLEGYLYPATYNSQNNVSLKTIVEQMVGKTNQELKPYFKKIKSKSLTINQALTLASFVESQHVSKDNGRKIAGVLYNRYNNDLPLEVKSSVMYANNKDSQKELVKKDYKNKSAYNLFIYKGLGPGPIGNPTITSLSAILNPKDMDKGYLVYKVNAKNKKVNYYSYSMSSN